MTIPEEHRRQAVAADLQTLQPLISEIRAKHGASLLAILVYGSWLRGKRDTMLDFYVLLDDYSTLDSFWQGLMCRLLPPNVYHIHLQQGGDEQRAKYALLTLKRFCNAVKHDFHSYFWARFAQPCKIVHARDEAVRTALEVAFNDAAVSFVRRVLPQLPERFSSRELWTFGLALTYRCELRTESSNRPETIYEYNAAACDRVTRSLAGANMSYSRGDQDDEFDSHVGISARRLSRVTWWSRRAQGKLLSVLRLGKAAFTFNDPLQYLLWKIERHTGIYIEPSPRQLRHPLIFAWPLLWRLYRRGAFR